MSARADRFATRPRWNSWQRLATCWWLLVNTWQNLETGPLHPLAEQVPLGQPRRQGHPQWCSQGGRHGGCLHPSVAGDGTTEWSHARSVEVEHLDGVADVFTLRMDALLPDGAHDVSEAIVLTATGSFDARQAEAYALAILEAVRLLDGGLAGTPGGLPAVLGSMPGAVA